MRDFKLQRGSRRTTMRFGFGVLAVLLLGLVTFVVGRAAWGMYGKFTQAAVADTQEQAQLASLRAQETQMSAAVQGLSTPRGVEEQVRERYGVAKPGEGVIQIVAPATSTGTSTAPQLNFFTKVWQMIVPW